MYLHFTQVIYVVWLNCKITYKNNTLYSLGVWKKLDIVAYSFQNFPLSNITVGERSSSEASWVMGFIKPWEAMGMEKR